MKALYSSISAALAIFAGAALLQAQTYNYSGFFPFEQKLSADGTNSTELVYDDESGDSGLAPDAIGGRLVFGINSDDIVEISVKGIRPSPVAGYFSFQVDENNRSRISGFKEEYTAYGVYLEKDSETSLSPGKYTALLLPCNLEEGVRMVFRNSAGQFAEAVFAQPLLIKAGGTVDLGEIDTKALFWEDALQVRFAKAEYMHGQTCLWPFKSPGKNPFPLSVKDEWQYKYTGKRYKLVTPGKQNLYLYASEFIAPHWAYGLRFGTKVGDYLELPGQSGKVIYKVKYITGDKNSEGGNPGIWTAADTPRRVKGGDSWRGKKQRSEEHVWMLSGLKEGEGCRLTLTKGSNESVWEVDVYYAKTSDLQKNAVSAAISGNAENTGNMGTFKASFVPAFACDLEKFQAGVQLRKAGGDTWTDIPWKTPATDFTVDAEVEYDIPYEYRCYAKGADNASMVYGNIRTFVPEAKIELDLDLNAGKKRGEGTLLDGEPITDNCSSTTSKWRGRSYKLKLGTAYEFGVWGSVGVGASTTSGLINGIRFNTYQHYKGNVYGTNTGDERSWIHLPEIPGFTLVSFEIKTGSNTEDIILASEADDKGAYTELESGYNLQRKNGNVFSCSFDSLEPGKSCYVYMKGYSLMVYRISLKYVRK